MLEVLIISTAMSCTKAVCGHCICSKQRFGDWKVSAAGESIIHSITMAMVLPTIFILPYIPDFNHRFGTFWPIQNTFVRQSNVWPCSQSMSRLDFRHTKKLWTRALVSYETAANHFPNLSINSWNIVDKGHYQSLSSPLRWAMMVERKIVVLK